MCLSFWVGLTAQFSECSFMRYKALLFFSLNIIPSEYYSMFFTGLADNGHEACLHFSTTVGRAVMSSGGQIPSSWGGLFSLRCLQWVFWVLGTFFWNSMLFPMVAVSHRVPPPAPPLPPPTFLPTTHQESLKKKNMLPLLSFLGFLFISFFKINIQYNK